MRRTTLVIKVSFESSGGAAVDDAIMIREPPDFQEPHERDGEGRCINIGRWRKRRTPWTSRLVPG